MRNDFSKAIDFCMETDKSNPFHQHIMSNNFSPELVSLRLQCFCINKLSLLSLNQEPNMLELYGQCIINIIRNNHFPYSNSEVVQTLIWHI